MAAKVVDHILPIKKGGERFERSNLQSLCVPCHNAKTASETASMR
jgi:5-methylcytosine-specific restriction protein A